MIKDNKEEYIPVENGFESSIYIESIHDDVNGFKIILFDKSHKKYCLTFESEFIYRVMDEGDRLKSFRNLTMDKKIMLIYRVKNSSFLKWFMSESLGKYSDFNFDHFAILTANTWIDVIALDPPKISNIP